MNPETENKVSTRRNHGIAAGVVLILIGLATLFQRWVDVTNFIILLLGLGMLVWGSISRRTGWLIPGGVLSGIGLGILVMQGPWQFPKADQGGIFLVCFALGWFSITILSALFTCLQWWPLIPGGIMALIGAAILVTNGAIPWQDLNVVYAAVLITVGIIVIAFRGRARKEE